MVGHIADGELLLDIAAATVSVAINAYAAAQVTWCVHYGDDLEDGTNSPIGRVCGSQRDPATTG